MVSPTEIRDPMDNSVVVDPDTAYSHINGMYFNSLQTQQMYFKALARGFEVKQVDGKLQLQHVPPQIVWELKDTDGFRRSHSGKYEVTNLQTGEYVMSTFAPHLHSSHTKRAVVVIVRIANSFGVMFQEKKIELNPKKVSFEFKFNVSRRQAPANARLEFTSNSLMKKTAVQSTITMNPTPSIVLDAEDARNQSNKIKLPGEYVAEFEKGVTGVGLKAGWDKSRGGAVIREIVHDSSAAKTNIKVGDLIHAVQGQRTDGMPMKTVLSMLKVVPLTMVLVLSRAPPDYVVAQTSGKERKIGGVKPNRSRAPPPLPIAVQPSIEPVPAVSHRHGRAATVTGTTPPQRPVRRSVPRPPSANTPPPPRPQSIGDLGSVPEHSGGDSGRTSAPSPPHHGGGDPSRGPPPQRPARVSSVSPHRQAPPLPPQPSARRVPPQQPIAASVGVAVSDVPPPTPPRPSHRSRAPPPPQPPTRSESPSVPMRAQAPSPPPPVPVTITQAAAAATTTTTTTAPYGPEFEKYVRMKRAGLPEGAIRNAFQRDGADPPPGFFGDSDDSASTSTSGAARQSPPPFRRAIPPSASTQPTAQPNFLAGIRDAKTSNALRHVEHKDEGPVPAAAGGGGGMLAGISGFDRSTLKHKDAGEIKKEKAAAAAADPNSMMGMLAGFDKSRLRSSSTPIKRSEGDRRATIASQGKQTLQDAMAAKIEALRGQIAGNDSDDDDEFDEDDTWEF